MIRPLFLFDIDGVLVKPAGYRRACRAAVNFFTRRMGIGDQDLGEEIFAMFESQNIISEWDMVPLILAAILDELLGRCPGLRLPEQLSGAFEDINSLRPPPQVDYQRITSSLGAGFQLGQTYADQALLQNRPGSPNPPFPNLEGQPILADILADARNLLKNPVTRIFQQFVLGCQTFQQAYGMPCELETVSYLQEYDRPALEKNCRDELLQLWQNDRLDLAVYTIRPSSLQPGLAEKALAYSPEAELALQINGLEGIPVMGYGQVYRSAELAGIKTDQILKPSAVQALAAIAAAVFRDELAAMQAAVDWSTGGQSAYFERLPALDIHIYEDSSASILGVKRAAEMLMQLDIPVSLHAWGIANNPAKISALRSVQAEIVMDVNLAIHKALGQLF